MRATIAARKRTGSPRLGNNSLWREWSLSILPPTAVCVSHRRFSLVRYHLFSGKTDLAQYLFASVVANVRRPFQVPVYEFKIDGDSVMRRRGDDWVNATHILKAAGFDKPARTRILEREVQKGLHEKVQGGYGKYQGM